MWKVLFTSKCEGAIRKFLKRGLLSDDDRRIIYKVDGKQIIVIVMRITPHHDYRKDNDEKNKSFQTLKSSDLRDLTSLFETKVNTPGKVIKAFRNNFRITQTELAEVTGISEKNISAIENERREVGILTAKKIAAFFGIDPALILFPNGPDETLKEYKAISAKGGLLIRERQKSYNRK